MAACEVQILDSACGQAVGCCAHDVPVDVLCDLASSVRLQSVHCLVDLLVLGGKLVVRPVPVSPDDDVVVVSACPYT